eukprot:gnl/TRDRNA2_/TRDRNA2_139023_c0_seq1.p1 gnl/TRDRNA2_/TRDRNA2_139023_c0~~gnl/TRDRNA2_/TRDRNA2_139023_c0_seq1.p1  ORF type:complete len:368 (+),score=60.96 gnl/TRDRNA2_/TRDRNA2_139023_c0_seq1:51-1106(+)
MHGRVRVLWRTLLPTALSAGCTSTVGVSCTQPAGGMGNSCGTASSSSISSDAAKNCPAAASKMAAATVHDRRGVPMPGLVYGTAWKKERTTDLVLKALRAGFRGVDTACQPKHYSEDLVGAAVERAAIEGIARDMIWLQTKYTPVGGQDHRVPYDQNAPLAQQVAQSFNVSKKNLRTDYIDSLVLHGPMDTHYENMQVWRAFEAIVDRGEVGQIGICNCYDLPMLQRIVQEARIKPSVVQNRFYDRTGFDEGLRRWCRANGIAYQSFWTLNANKKAMDHPEFQKVATAHSRTPEQIMFRFCLDEGISPLTGTCSEKHMEQDLEVLDDPPLSNDERRLIWQLLRTVLTPHKN